MAVTASRVVASAEDQRRAIRAVMERAGVTVGELWRRYFALGGDLGSVEVEAYLYGLTVLPPLQRDLLAHAVNEWLEERTGRSRVPYSHAVRDTGDGADLLAALSGLLAGTHRAPPERLAAVVAEAGAAIGVRAVLYLVDYEQRRLMPVPAGPRHTARPLGVNSTLAGRVFRTARALASQQEPGRLWMPLVDGVERLGVLGIDAGDAAGARDPVLREQCRLLAKLAGHMVVVTSHYGDELDLARRTQPRSATAELIWRLLPPLTAGTDRVTVSGLVEPAYTSGGDVFDYALSENAASLAIFDAMGHSLSAGLLSAATLAAYRSTRRDGRGLYDAARAIDETISGQRDDAFVTGVLAHLELNSGRLRYLAAGHPAPLLLRAGKVVRTLDDGRRMPFGLGIGEATVAEITLEPDDVLVLYTDGVTEGRHHSGQLFGEQRLVDFLERQAAGSEPAPETLRRLMHTVLAHQEGSLRDDATVVLAHWHPAGSAVPPP
jgi:Stage II sporulation protein E (SpoIIE)